MTELLFSPALRYGLAAGAVVFAALAVLFKRPSGLWALSAGLCTAAAVPVALLQGRTLAEALNAVLIVTAVALAGLCGRRDGK